MMDTRPYFSIIIVNYNGLEHLEQLFCSLQQQSFQDFEILFIDNGSTDGSLAYLQQSHPRTKIISNTTNSFSQANNRGIAAAIGKYILFINNDVALDRGCLAALDAVTRASNQHVGMWAMKILNYYDHSLIDSVGLSIYADGISRGRGRLEHDQGQFDSVTEVLYPSGCGALFTKEVLDEIGMFDERFGFYLEDTDLGLRARLAGWTCQYVPAARLYHKYSSTAGKYSLTKAYLVERNRIWLVAKLFPWRMILVNPWHTLCRYAVQAYGLVISQGASSNFVKQYSFGQTVGIMFKAWAHAIVGIRQALRQRKAILRSKRVNNQTFASWFRKFGISAREVALKD